MASGGGEEGEHGLQIAPLLDLLFVLLLFFMISAGSKVRELELSIKIPAGGGKSLPGTPDMPITLDVRYDGAILYNGSPVDTPRNKDLPELTSRLKDIISKFGEKQQVIVTPQRKARHERVMDVLNACTAAGVKNLAFGSAPL